MRDLSNHEMQSIEGGWGWGDLVDAVWEVWEDIRDGTYKIIHGTDRPPGDPEMPPPGR